MWILWLLFGLILGSPLPEFENEYVSSINDGAETEETKSLPQLHTIPFAPPQGSRVAAQQELLTNPAHEVEDLQPISITSPTMFNHGSQQKQKTPETLQSQTSKRTTDNKRVHITSEVRTVSIQINKEYPVDTAESPVVFDQQPPEINLEPTEVEAPGTTPTTLSMVTESHSSTIHNSPITFIDQSFLTEINDEKSSDLNSRVIIIESKDIEHKPQNISKVTSIKQEEGRFSDNDDETMKIKVLDEFLQQDDPRISMMDGYPTKAVVREENHTMKKDITGHPTAFVITHSSKEKGIVNEEASEKSQIADINDDLIVPVMIHEEDGSIKIAKIVLNNAPNKTEIMPSKSEKNNNNSETILTANNPVMLESKLKKEVRLSTSSNDSKDIDKSEKYSADGTPDLIVKETNVSETQKGDSTVIETREANEETFFHTLDSAEERKSRVYIKDNGQTVQDNDKPDGYVSVYTSSSEIDYRNFNPEVKISNKTSASDKAKERNNATLPQLSSSTEPRVGNKPLEQPRISHVKITYNDNNSNRNEEVHQNISHSTSLPSQISLVKPLRDRVSGSSLRREPLPSSGQITKTSHESRIIPGDHRQQESTEPVYLEVYPKKTSSLSTPVRKERVSVKYSEEDEPMSGGSLTAIVLTILFTLIISAGGVAYYWYNRRSGIRPKVLSSDRSCSNSDSGGYLDDQCRVAYVNSQVDLSKSTQEDLVSLDNDSFLNSLESMTIQNLWTDSIRHTKL